MTSIPPWPQEFLTRVIADTRRELRFDATQIRARVGAQVTEATGIVEAERDALALLSERWDRLALPLAAALVRVARDYAQHPLRIAQLREELLAKGSDSWIAFAVRAQLAFDIGFDAVTENDGCLDL